MKKDKSNVLTIGLLISLAATVVLPITSASAGWKDDYEAKSYRNAEGKTLPYRLLRPLKIQPGKRYPLVLFLHGAGERGIDNALQLCWLGDFSRPENRQKYPCFLLAPQCPPDKRWVEVDWGLPSHTMPEKLSAPLRLALELVGKLAAELPVDKGRLYVTGLSMGGFGTWDAIQRRPAYFAAAMPVCGGGDTAQAPQLKNLPLWAFHGSVDTVVLTRRTTDMIEAIRRAGGTPKMTIYPGVGHGCWTYAYADPKVMAWLFAQHK